MEIWPRDGTQGDWDQKGVWMKRLEYVGEGMRRLDGLWVLEWDWTLGSKDPCWAEPGDGIGLNRDQRTSVKCIWGNNSRWLGIWGVSTAEMTSAAHREELDLSKNEFSVLSVWYYGNISGWANSTVMVSGSQEPRELQLVSSVTESCPTLGCPTDCSPPGSSVPGILQARILEWDAVSFSRGSFRPRDRARVSCVSCIAGGLFTTHASGKVLGSLITSVSLSVKVGMSDRTCTCVLTRACVHVYAQPGVEARGALSTISLVSAPPR